MPLLKLAFTLLIFGILSTPNYSHAQAPEFAGHIKYQVGQAYHDNSSLQAALGPDSPFSEQLDLRVNLERAADSLRFIAQAEALGYHSTGLQAERQARLSPYSSAERISDRTRLFDLTVEVANESDVELYTRIDRLYLDYAQAAFVLRAGRQAITWGNGLNFQVIDIFNPFSPVEIDKDYKTGDDIVYSQMLFFDGSDLQFLAVPRRDFETHDPESSASSFAAKYHARLADSGIEYDLMAAQHFNEPHLALGLSRDLFGSIARADVVWIDLEGRSSATNFLLNLDRSWYILESNFYSFIEYFHNSIGVSQDQYLIPDEALSSRISRGELYTLSTDYLSVGARLEASPLLNLYLTYISNLRDGSSFVQNRNVYEITQDLSLLVGFSYPLGSNGTEFGGLKLPNDQYLRVSPAIFLRTAYFF
ncbi:MAG: hypothetical protein KDD42_04060 [Bdellovibrionales bacterium]|nr:hypothetical protein [Bdellovibrionales bacterium]